MRRLLGFRFAGVLSLACGVCTVQVRGDGNIDSRISQAARMYGYSVADGSYSFGDVSCMPAHHYRVLRFESSGLGSGLSRFIAVVPQDRNSRVEILPILISGAVPFLSAEQNPGTIAVFNRIVPPESFSEAEQRARGLCFLGLIGESERSATRDGHLPDWTLRHLAAGEEEQVFSARGVNGEPRVWTLTFSSRGVLLRVKSERAMAPPMMRAEAAAGPQAGPAMVGGDSSANRLNGSPAASAPEQATGGRPAVVPADARAPAVGSSHAKGIAGAGIPGPPMRFVPEPPQPPSRRILDENVDGGSATN